MRHAMKIGYLLGAAVIVAAEKREVERRGHAASSDAFIGQPRTGSRHQDGTDRLTSGFAESRRSRIAVLACGVRIRVGDH